MQIHLEQLATTLSCGLLVLNTTLTIQQKRFWSTLEKFVIEQVIGHQSQKTV